MLFICFGPFMMAARRNRGPPHLSSPHAGADANANATPNGIQVVGPVGPVGALVVLKVAQPLIVPLDLVAQDGILLMGTTFVVLQAPDAVQALQIDPATKPDANAVHDEMRF